MYIVHLMYIAVISPILTYGAHVWWKMMDKKLHIFIPDWEHRCSCLYIHQVFQPRESEELKNDHVGQSTILISMGCSTLLQGTKYLLLKSHFSTIFGSRIPSKYEWMVNFIFMDFAISVFTNGSEMVIAFGIFSVDLDTCVSQMHAQYFWRKNMQSI